MTHAKRKPVEQSGLLDAVAMVDTLQAYLAKRLPPRQYTMLHKDIVYLRSKIRNQVALAQDAQNAST